MGPGWCAVHSTHGERVGQTFNALEHPGNFCELAFQVPAPPIVILLVSWVLNMTSEIEKRGVFIFSCCYHWLQFPNRHGREGPEDPGCKLLSPKPCSDFTYAFTLAAAFLTLNTIGAILRMSEDIPAVSFTVTLYVFLMIFFWCVSAFEKMPHDSKNRERLKILVWVLATTLSLMFAYRVWTMVRPGVALGLLVWGMVGITSVITFYFFFVFGDKKTTSAEEWDCKASCDEQVYYARTSWSWSKKMCLYISAFLCNLMKAKIRSHFELQY